MARTLPTDFILYLMLFLGVVLTLGASAGAIESFEPNIADPLLASWRWQHIKQLDGLSFQCMTQDANGVMWFGLRNGVLRYNGQQWRYFRRSSTLLKQVNSILASANGSIYALTNIGISQLVDDRWKLLFRFDYVPGLTPGQTLAEDSSGTIWAATPNGLVRIHGQEAEFYLPVAGGVTTVFVDSIDNLWWLGTDGSEFQVIPLRQGQIESKAQSRRFSLYPKNSKRKAYLTQTHDGPIWIGSDIPGDPLHIYDPHADAWTQSDPNATGSHFACTSMLETRDGTLWMTSLDRLRAVKEGRWKVYAPTQVRISSLQTALLETADGAFWIGEVNGRVYRVERSDKQCLSYHGLHFQCENIAGRRWFLSETGTVVSQAMSGDIWEHYDQQDNVIDTPVVIIATRDGSVWAAGSHAGDAAVSRFDGERWTRWVFASMGYGISHYSAFETAGGDVVFGNAGGTAMAHELGMEYGGGILRFRRTAQGYEAEHIPSPTVPFRVVGIAETAEGLWFGGSDLVCFDGHASRNMEASLTLPPSYVDQVMNTRDKRLWVAKGGEGLFVYDGQMRTHYTAREGLASNMICYVCEHPDGTILAATSNGISRFDGELWQTLTLPDAFRLDRESGSLHVTASGEIWVNQTERAWYFRVLAGKVALPPIDSPFLTSRYQPNDAPPHTTISPLAENDAVAASVIINWTGQDAWFSTPQEHLRYSYRLDEGVWSPFYPKTGHTLSDLTPGKHVFEVRARDRDFNVEPQPASITFTVMTPVWRRLWFILLNSVFLTTIAVLIVYLVRIHQARVTQQLVFEKQKAQQELAIDESRLAFFTNISHELRTPLTLILGPLEGLLSKLTENTLREKAVLAKRNADRLLQLVNQLLDMRKLQAGNLQFNPTEDDVIRFASDLVESMQPAAEQRQLTLEFQSSVPQLAISFDPDKLEKIVVNLISNAIKFTPEQGRVTVTVEPRGDKIELTVEDTGIGVPPSQLEHVFDRFYRATDSSVAPGSGIGLSFVKELVQLHSGTISAVSPADPQAVEHPGTRITVQLPGDAAATRSSDRHVRLDPAESPQGQAIETVDHEGKTTVLLVEDNDDMRLYVGSMLTESDYRVLEAKDGQEALARAREAWPDLIVSDIMMPKMDGLELCSILKTDESTSHIPVILLTAKRSEEAQVLGLKTGADDYISKPFSNAVLLARISNLLESRRALQKRFKRDTILDPKKITVTSTDERFLRKTMDVLEENMGDYEFDVDAFAGTMPMSRSSLYRKIKALTGQSPSVFIRTIRLKRAAALLESGQLNVSEVAYRVGFLEISYFSTCFKNQFGCTASQYRAKHGPKDETG